ncbi:glutathione S-transferase family protein [Wenxinia saemankumensis]|uniref:Glutathione S-transferase n=1 Tax=Wenxinia saemankumensis TaxID=1447782 RepID=A0A1M6FPF4_9RHOB|nr:glutathione S-transferase family protein [Wenxinia saemankumensis]SHI99567.1 glutathione S-transferase [Wenxinia saemankumensis]
MLTFFHAPRSRSSRIRTLLTEMDLNDRVETRIVSIPRQEGSGGPDDANPHPDRKVPALIHDGALVTETSAIMLYLTDLFPEAGLGAPIGDPKRAEFLTWLAWYGDVMEPVIIAQAAGLDHPILRATFRGPAEMTARLEAALARGPWLLGDRYSAADLLCASPFLWFPDATPDSPAIRDWVARIGARPAYRRTAEMDEADLPSVTA